MNRFQRVFTRHYLKLIYRFNAEKYKREYPKFLRKLGVNIPEDYFEGGHGFIHPSVAFDGNDFSLISIGKNTTISADVVFLTHDYSISKGLQMIGSTESGRFLKPISIGKNCFVGMRTMILPGTTIGDNVIIGSAAVVKGNIPDGVIVVGNPAKIIGNTKEWAERHYEKHDYEVV